MSKSAIPSPCVSICALDENDICIGCYRSAKEIAEWMLMEDDEKLAVLEKASTRVVKKTPYVLK